MVQQGIVDYIKEQLDAGVSPKYIEKALSSAGWGSDDVNDTIQFVLTNVKGVNEKNSLGEDGFVRDKSLEGVDSIEHADQKDNFVQHDNDDEEDEIYVEIVDEDEDEDEDEYGLEEAPKEIANQEDIINAEDKAKKDVILKQEPKIVQVESQPSIQPEHIQPEPQSKEQILQTQKVSELTLKPKTKKKSKIRRFKRLKSNKAQQKEKKNNIKADNLSGMSSLAVVNAPSLMQILSKLVLGIVLLIISVILIMLAQSFLGVSQSERVVEFNGNNFTY